MKGFPEKIATERLILRVAKPGDGKAMHHAIKQSHQDLSPWLGWVTPMPTEDQVEQNCRGAYARFLLNEDLMVLIFKKDDGELIGGSSLHDPHWEVGCFEVGYWGHSAFTGQGFMTEAIRGISDFALNELDASRVFLTTDERNERSWRLAERAGFEYEGTLRNERFDLEGKLRNTRVYARVKAL